MCANRELLRCRRVRRNKGKGLAKTRYSKGLRHIARTRQNLISAFAESSATSGSIVHQLPSLHAFTEIYKQLISGFEADQARARVFHIEHDVNDDNGEECKAENV